MTLDFLWFIASVIICVVVLISAKNFTNYKIIFSKKMLFSLMIWILFVFFMHYFEFEYVTVFLFLIIYPLLFVISFKKKFKECLFLSISLWLLGMIVDFLIMLIIALVVDVDMLSSFEFELVEISANIAMPIILLLSSYCKPVIFVIDKIRKFLDKLHIFDFTVFFVIIAMILFGIFIDINLDSPVAVVITVVLIFLILVLIYLSTYIKFTNSNYSRYVDFLNKSISNYIEKDRDNNVFRHNIVHKLNALKSLLPKEYKSHVQDLVKEIKSKDSKIENLDAIPEGINGFLYEKLTNLDSSYKIVIDNEVDFEIAKVLSFRKYLSLCEALGVLLDNAIEATREADVKYIRISFACQNNLLLVEVTNSFKNCVNINSLGQYSYSTKNRGSGYGLFSLFHMNDIKLNVSIINELFISKLQIKIK